MSLQGECFKYFSEPSYPEDLSLKSALAPGAKSSCPEENVDYGEMPADFHVDVVDNEQPGKEPAETEDIAPVEEGRHATRQATRKWSASAAAGSL